MLKSLIKNFGPSEKNIREAINYQALKTFKVKKLSLQIFTVHGDEGRHLDSDMVSHAEERFIFFKIFSLCF